MTYQVLKCPTVISLSDLNISFICLDKEIKHSPQICTLQSYYETYQKFIKAFCLLKHKYL